MPMKIIKKILILFLFCFTCEKVFAEENAAQCGYCTAGVIVSISGLFAKNPRPTDKQVKEVLCRHLCRCGSHPRILAAIEKLRGQKLDE